MMTHPFKLVAVLCLALPFSFGSPAVADTDDGKTSKGDQAPAELSVAPLDHIDYPLDRPPWIEDTGDYLDASEGKDVLIAVTSGPAPSPEIAVEIMHVMARGAVENYVDRLGQNYSEPIDTDAITIDMDWVRNELIGRQYDGTVTSGELVQYESACLLRIDASHRQTLDRLVQNQRLMHRMAAVGVVSVLCLLGLLGGSIFFGWASSRQNTNRAATPNPLV